MIRVVLDESPVVVNADGVTGFVRIGLEEAANVADRFLGRPAYRKCRLPVRVPVEQRSAL
jgi:hypothetical protein